MDVCIVFPFLNQDGFSLAAEIGSKLREYLDRPLDIIVLDKNTFDQRSKENWTLEYEIKNEGITV